MTNEMLELLLPLVACMAAAGVVCVWLGRLLARKTGRGWAAFLPLAGYILLMCLLGSYAVPRLEQMGDIVLPEPTVTTEQAALGAWMTRIGMIAFLVMLVITRLMDRKLKTLLLTRDAAHHGGIVPNRLMLLWTLLPLCAMCLIVMGVVVSSGDMGAALILLLGGGVMAGFLLKDQFTRLTLDGGTLTLRRFGREWQYQIADICDIRWRSCRGVTGTALVIIFSDGKSFWFPMDSFRGVQNTYNKLTKRLQKEK